MNCWATSPIGSAITSGRPAAVPYIAIVLEQMMIAQRCLNTEATQLFLDIADPALVKPAMSCGSVIKETSPEKVILLLYMHI